MYPEYLSAKKRKQQSLFIKLLSACKIMKTNHNMMSKFLLHLLCPPTLRLHT